MAEATRVADGNKAIVRIGLVVSIAALSIALPLPAHPQGESPVPAVALHGGDEALEVGRFAYFLEDRAGALEIGDVRRLAIGGSFAPNASDAINFGFTRSAYWLWIDVVEASGGRESVEWFLEISYPLLDRIDAYVYEGDLFVKAVSAGRSVPYDERGVKSRNFVFPFEFKPGTRYSVFLRIQTASSMNFPLVFRSPLDSAEVAKDEQFFFGLYYGILIVMAVFNLFVFATVRQSNYLSYVAYVVTFGLFQLSLNGLDVEYLWQNAGWWTMRAPPFLGSLTSIAINVFSKRFLLLKSNAPIFDKILTVVMSLVGINVLVSLVADYSISIQVLSAVTMFGSFAMIAAGVRCWMAGFRPARLYVVAWVAFTVGIIIMNMKSFGLLPYSFLTNNAMQIGSALEVVLMSFALADRLRLMQREKEDVQRHALESQVRMTGSFSRFVPKEFLALLKRDSIVDIELGDRVLREMPVLFADIRSYTTLSEKMTPRENIDFLNEYLARIVPVIREHGGFIDKYIGDAIMALFPGGVDDAVAAAVAMQRAVGEFNATRSASGADGIAIGIGIHVGELMLGTIGQEDRLETTVISDAVNIASRLEGLTKRFGAGILISDEVFGKLSDAGRFDTRMLGLVDIRGRKNPVKVLEVAYA
jgi:adenylate cyclase